VFPYMVLPLFIARERSVAAVEDALAGDRLVLLTAQRDADIEDPEPDDLFRIGTVAMVMRILRMGDGRVKVLVQGLAKASIDGFVDHERGIWAQVSEVPEDEETDWSVEAEAVVRSVRGRVEELLPLKNLPPEVLSITANVHEAGRLADLVASNLKLRASEAQEILEIRDPLARLRRVDALLRRELDVTTVQAEIQSQAHDEMTRSQREHFLREQLRAIQAELGESDPRVEEVDDYRGKVEESGMPEEPNEEAMKQVRRLERMHPDGPEAQVVRNYLDWMVELPWNTSSPDRLDLASAQAILDEDHAHLREIKDRILEYLGVRKLRSDSRGPILCFVGPPGVGKTSLGRSIARAMGREFVRISLGGVRDEAEIRGHRRTYVGAMPGRIIQGFKTAGTNNPVFMLDEMDKLGSDFRGDPASSLLEVLDPAQNSEFSDHFLNVPFDLSKVMFIATANQIDLIPGPLRDRMEVIPIAGYTPEEKVEIARSYLIPKQVAENGLAEDTLSWSPAAVMGIDPRSAAESLGQAVGARRDRPRERARVDRERRRSAHHRGEHDPRQGVGVDGAARRRDEGVGTDCTHVCAHVCNRARLRRGLVLAPRSTRARSCGRDPEGRAVCGHRDRHGVDFARGSFTGAGGCRDDGRGDATRAGTADRWYSRKGDGCTARGNSPRDPPGQERAGSSRHPEGSEASHHVHSGRDDGRGIAGRARVTAGRCQQVRAGTVRTPGWLRGELPQDQVLNWGERR